MLALIFNISLIALLCRYIIAFQYLFSLMLDKYLHLFLKIFLGLFVNTQIIKNSCIINWAFKVSIEYPLPKGIILTE